MPDATEGMIQKRPVVSASDAQYLFEMKPLSPNQKEMRAINEIKVKRLLKQNKIMEALDLKGEL